ncbi:MAG: DUF2493 domain-containing protein [Cyanobacteria bacterium P01_E01_bin.6]
MREIKLIIAGTRTFNDYNFLKSKLDFYLSQKNEKIEIVCGGCQEPDMFGVRYAKQKGFSVEYFYPDWQKYGRAAGPMRNKDMAQYATHCVVFWDGRSRGTASMIELVKQYELNLRVVRY